MRIYRFFSKHHAGFPIVCSMIMGLFGCAGNPPINTIASADTALTQAMTVNASEHAPEEIQRALEKLSRAKQALADEEYEDARRLAKEARVDARAAEAKARSENARQMAQQTQKIIEALRREAVTKGQSAGAMNP
ncbi:DUF4398 domain-containing protein [Methylocaldum sp. MU1018]